MTDASGIKLDPSQRIASLELRMERMDGQYQSLQKVTEETKRGVERILEMLKGEGNQIGVMEALREIKREQAELRQALDGHIEEHKCEADAAQAAEKDLVKDKRQRIWTLQNGAILTVVSYFLLEIIKMVLSWPMPVK